MLSNLTAGQTYYYQAFVTVSGTGDYASQSQTFYGAECSFTTKKVATATVSNSAATSVTSSSAQLNGSFSGASGQIYETGFYWGTSADNLDNKVTTYGSNNASGSFSCAIGNGSEPLSASTTYYFKAYVLEWNENTSAWVERPASNTLSFTTSATSSQTTWQNYLNDYGMPDVSGIVSGLRKSGTFTDRDDHWYSVNTSNNNRQIAIHTYTDGAPNNAETLNYVVLYDGSRYAPVWTYHVMNTTYWPDDGNGRTGSWTTDPAVSLTQQTGLDNGGSTNNGGCGYSRGHLVASNYRQTNATQNNQTFYYTNQAPQWQDSFNSGVWSTLEGRVKTMTPSGTTMLYVVTGVLYEGTVSNNEVTSSTVPTKKSGSLNVPIPSHFYKCIMKCTFNGSTITEAQGIAFVYTNEAHSGKYYANTFVTSIDAIEARAGFDFFANVPANLQNTAESNLDARWFEPNASAPSNNISGITGNNWGSF